MHGPELQTLVKKITIRLECKVYGRGKRHDTRLDIISNQIISK